MNIFQQDFMLFNKLSTTLDCPENALIPAWDSFSVHYPADQCPGVRKFKKRVIPIENHP